MESNSRGHWGSRVGFILAAAGSAVGLGNLWKFPYVAGRYGGGAFIIVYVAILATIGFAVMMAELTIGKKTQLSPIGAYRKLKSKWAFVGWLGLIAGVLILAFYAVIGGWIIKYLVASLSGAATQLDAEAAGNFFTSFISGTSAPIFYQALFMALTVFIVFFGIKGGIEKASKIMMPALFVLLIVLAVRALTLPGAFEGVKFMFKPDWSAFSDPDLYLGALGQAFFSLSLGMGCMITYGSYLSEGTNIEKSATSIIILDTAIAIIAGLVVLPACFAVGVEPGAGPGLMFITLPSVFSQMPLGSLFQILFFVLVLFAALTSAISLLEITVSSACDELKMPRSKSAILAGIFIFLVGIPTSLGLGVWSDVTLIKGLDILDSYSYVAENVLMPLGAFLMAIFIGWVWKIDNAVAEITEDGTIPFKSKKYFTILIKYICPIAIGIILITSL